MSSYKCIVDGLNTRISAQHKSSATQAAKKLDELFRRVSLKTNGRPWAPDEAYDPAFDADPIATAAAVDLIIKERTTVRSNLIMADKAVRDMQDAHIKDNKDIPNPDNIARSVIAYNSSAHYSNVTPANSLALFWKQQFWGELDNTLIDFTDRAWGKKPGAVQAIYAAMKKLRGEPNTLDYDPSFDGIAQAFRTLNNKITRILREKFNLPVDDNPDWNPFTVSPKKLMPAGLKRGETKAEFVADMFNAIDISKTRVLHRGRPYTEGELIAALGDLYDEVIGAKPRGKPAGGDLATSKIMARVWKSRDIMHFKDVDSYQRMSAKYTEHGDDLLMNWFEHLNQLSRDLALMQTLGPYPERTLQYIAEGVGRLKLARSDQAGVGLRASSELRLEGANATVDSVTQSMFDTFVGKAYQTDNYRLAEAVEAGLGYFRGTLLGSTVLFTPLDHVSMVVAHFFSGLPGWSPVIRALYDAINIFSRKRTEQELVDTGLAAEMTLSLIVGHARVEFDAMSPGTRRFSDIVQRASGAHTFFRAGVNAFNWYASNLLARNLNNAWDALPADLKVGMGRHGIDAKLWDAIRAVPPAIGKSTNKPLLDLHAIADNSLDAAAKLSQYIDAEQHFAMVAPPLQTTAAMNRIKGRPGSWQHTIFSTLTFLKSFPMAIYHTWLTRFVNDVAMRQDAKIGVPSRLVLGASYMISTTLIGMLLLQIQTILAGRDPRPMVGPHAWKTWSDAFLKAGSFGLFGDVFGSGLVSTFEEKGFYAGAWRSLSGPIGERLGYLAEGGYGLYQDLNGSKEAKTYSTINRLDAALNPMHTMIWGKTAWQLFAIQGVSEALDPSGTKAILNQQRRQARSVGTDIWLGRRAPDLSNAIDTR